MPLVGRMSVSPTTEIRTRVWLTGGDAQGPRGRGHDSRPPTHMHDSHRAALNSPVQARGRVHDSRPRA